MTVPTDAAIRAYAADLIRDLAAEADHLDLAGHLADQDTIGGVLIADLDGPAIEDIQRRILDAVHAWGNEETYVDALQQLAETPDTDRLTQIHARNQYLAYVPFDAHGGTHGRNCIPCELVRTIGDVRWLLKQLGAATAPEASGAAG